MILMLEIVLGSIIIGAFIVGAVLLLIYLLRWLLYKTTGDVERKPRAENPLDKEESFASLDIISSGNEHPCKDPEAAEVSGEGSTAAPKQPPRPSELEPPPAPPNPKFKEPMMPAVTIEAESGQAPCGRFDDTGTKAYGFFAGDDFILEPSTASDAERYWYIFQI